MRTKSDNALKRFITALRVEPLWKIKASPFLYRLLLAGGAHSAARPDSMRERPDSTLGKLASETEARQRDAVEVADLLEDIAAELRANPGASEVEKLPPPPTIDRPQLTGGRPEVVIGLTWMAVPKIWERLRWLPTLGLIILAGSIFAIAVFALGTLVQWDWHWLAVYVPILLAAAIVQVAAQALLRRYYRSYLIRHTDLPPTLYLKIRKVDSLHDDMKSKPATGSNGGDRA